MTESHDPVGSAAEEAAKLLGAVAEWARDLQHEGVGDLAAGLGTGLGAAAHDVDAHLANGEDCRYCPICRAVQVFRSASPEVREHLAAAASSLAQAAAAALATAVPERRSSSMEHIDLTDDDLTDDWPQDEPGDDA